ncbi:hypothetical protein KEM54_002002, partial [Ascosphaera aggregata]
MDPSPSSTPVSRRSGNSPPLPSPPDNTSNDNIFEDDAKEELPSSRPASSSSSQPPSVEIDVADVEEMDQDPSKSRWRSLKSATQQDLMMVGGIEGAEELVEEEERRGRRRTSSFLVDEFPRPRTDCDVHEALAEINRILERGLHLEINAFFSVKAWFAKCEQNFNLLTYDQIVKDRLLWDEIPSIVEAVMRRHRILLPDEGEGPSVCLEKFFLSFAALALHMVRLDSQMFKKADLNNNLELDSIVSARYLSPLCWCLQITGIPLFQALQNAPAQQDLDVVGLIGKLNAKVALPPFNAIQTLAGFTTLSLRLMPKWPKLVYPFISSCMIIANIIDFSSEFATVEETIISPELREILEEAYSFFRTVDVAYQTYISNKTSSLTSDSCEMLFKLIGNAYDSCAKLMPDFAPDIARALEIDIPDDTEAEVVPTIIRTRWRLQVLRKQIMEGRMELRVSGIETMQSDLVSLWRAYLGEGSDISKNPVIQSTVQYIKSSRLLEYIVGIDSHEQLISRGTNIVGFLILIGAYTDEETDTIWRTVTDGQDSRIVPDVLKMLTQTFSYHKSTSSALLYLCQKLRELPLNRFDATMTDYTDQLLSQIREKLAERRALRTSVAQFQPADMIPIQLCARIMRETPAVPELSSENKQHLQRFASKQLAFLLEMGVPDDFRIEMYKQCIKDISESNAFAFGSIRVAFSLLQFSGSDDLAHLIGEFDFTRLIIDELGKFCETVKSDSSPQRVFHELFPRMQLIHFIIEHSPQSLSEDLCDCFWREMFERQTFQEQCRNLVFDMLAKATHSAIQNEKQNHCLDQIFREKLPTVRPEVYSFALLNLATKAVLYGLSFNFPGTPEPGDQISFPGMDQLWRIIANAPPQTIELAAMDRAIELYLDHPLVQNSDDRSVETTHVALVDRCISELTIAASRLKQLREHSSDDESQDEPDAESHTLEQAAEELRFTRHLLFMRQFIKGLQSRPQYSPLKRQSPALPPEGKETGKILDVTYQTFNGASHSGVQTLRMSEKCTAQQLLEKLTQVSGFSKFITIMGGRKIDLTINPTETIGNLKVGQLGLLMVKKHPEAS